MLPRNLGCKQKQLSAFWGGTSRIDKAAMGFLFIGDFFDRYWTCHAVEYDPSEYFHPQKYFQTDNVKHQIRMKDCFKEVVRPPNQILPTTDLEKRPWCQRKVLELILFDRILRTISE